MLRIAAVLVAHHVPHKVAAAEQRCIAVLSRHAAAARAHTGRVAALLLDEHLA